MKYSGIILDKHFNFKAHNEYLCRKASQRVVVLHRIMNKIDTFDRIIEQLKIIIKTSAFLNRYCSNFNPIKTEFHDLGTVFLGHVASNI